MSFSWWIMAMGAPLLVACSSSNKNEPAQMGQLATTAGLPERVVELPNTPRCLNAGGNMTLARQLDGSTVGMCQLANGKRF